MTEMDGMREEDTVVISADDCHRLLRIAQDAMDQGRLSAEDEAWMNEHGE